MDVRDARANTIRLVLEPFLSPGEQVSKGGSYKWTCLVSSTDDHPFILSGSSSKVLTHFQTSGGGEVQVCNSILNNQASRDRLKEATKVCGSHLQELAAKKLCNVEAQKSADVVKAGGLASFGFRQPWA